MAEIIDRGLHITSHEYGNLTTFMNSVMGVEDARMDAVIETYRTMYRRCIKIAEKLTVGDVVEIIADLAMRTQRPTVQLYIVQWWLYKVDTDSNVNDMLMHDNMNAMSIIDLMHYVSGDDGQLKTVTPELAEELVNIKIPFRNFLAEMQIGVSFDLHDKRNRLVLGSII